MNVARLPIEIGEHLSEIDGMLAGAAGDFEHETALRKPFPQNFDDRLTIAQRRRGRPARPGNRSFVEAALIGHQPPPTWATWPASAPSGAGFLKVRTGFLAARVSSSRRRGA